MQRFRHLVLAATLAAAAPAFAFGAHPEHSAVDVQAKDDAGAKQFTLKIEAKSGMVVNFDAPWKLELKGHDGLSVAKTSYAKADMDEKLPGFVFAAKTEKPQGDLEYALTAFVCTQDKTQCFREVHNGKAAWTAAK
jgi:hypothetical protein